MTASDFTFPEGQVREDNFPDHTTTELESAIETWITSAETKVAEANATDVNLDSDEQEEAVSAWVYYRAFQSVYLRLRNDPLEADLGDGGSLKYTEDQVQSFMQRAQFFREKFQEYVSPDDRTPETPRSSYVQSSAHW